MATAAPFAAAQARVNAATMRRLANAVGTVDGAAVDMIYTRASDIAGVDRGVYVRNPQAVVMDASVPAAPVGKPVTVGAAAYTIAAADPDGDGFTTLVLESA